MSALQTVVLVKATSALAEIQQMAWIRVHQTAMVMIAAVAAGHCVIKKMTARRRVRISVLQLIATHVQMVPIQGTDRMAEMTIVLV